MNKAYRLIWSAVRECWMVVSEKVSAKGCLPAITVGALTVATLFGSGNIVHALPGGGQAVAGQATISQPAAGQMNINQTSNRAVINWSTFGIASGETVNISQPSSQSALLNRIVGNSPSEIFGKLNANGQVFLVNPNGVLFGKGASVNVGGLVASSLNIKDNDFMSANLSFNKDGQAGSVINQGEISAGFVALLGPQVSNSGSIIAIKGSVALGAADSITLNFDNNGLIALKLDQGALNAQAGNSGLIEADGGRVLLTAKSADNILKSMVNNTGVIQARTVENRNGEIILLGDMQNGTVNVGGALDATAPVGGTGGFIETSAAKVTIADNAKVTTLSTQGTNGTWLIDPDGFTIAASGGDMTGAQVQSALAGGNLSILSVNGSGAGGNINVNDTISWNANKLTLTATNDININNVMTASGSSTLDLNAGGQVLCALNTATGVFTGKVDLPGRSGTGILTINGAGYTVINSLGAEDSITGLDLQGMNGNLTGRYVLGSDIDAGATSGWELGFKPVGNVNNAFNGTFNGLGHTVNGLFINVGLDDLGLFGVTHDAVLSNVSLTNASIYGGNNVGGLIGRHNSGTTNIYNSFTSGTITGYGISVGGVVGYYNGGDSGGSRIMGLGSSATVNGDYIEAVGGLVGYYHTGAGGGASFVDSASSATVTGSIAVGGLVGLYRNGTGGGAIFANNSSSGTVSGDTNNVGIGNSVGGLVGAYEAVASGSNSFRDNVSSATVTGNEHVGGLVGTYHVTSANNTLTNNSSSGTVTGYYDVGGLIGYAQNVIISNNKASGAVIGHDNVGGQIGEMASMTFDGTGLGTLTANVTGNSNVGGVIGSMINSTLTNTTVSGSVSGTGDNVGGLVGLGQDLGQTITIANSSNSSVVSGNYAVGGLAGYLQGTVVTDSYNTGAVSGIYLVGGLAGLADQGSIANSQNSGTVTAKPSFEPERDGFIGGLVGCAGCQTNPVSISNSYNTGAVSGIPDNGMHMGGLVGYLYAGTVSDSYNTGTVSGTTIVGGLVGEILPGTAITNSHSTGAVTGSGADIGGLVGRADVESTISNDYSTGLVNGGGNVGGLVGNAISGSVIIDSTASGDVIATGDNVGGLIGYADNITLSGSIASGAVSGSSFVGGQIGVMLNMTYDGSGLGTPAVNVTGYDYTGGIIGQMVNSTLTNSSVSGTVTGHDYVGGLTGSSENISMISNSVNSANVTGHYMIGGVAGIANNTRINDVHGTAGAAIAGTSDYVGGLVGSATDNSIILHSYNDSAVSGNNGVGGLVGLANSTTITESYNTGAVTGAGNFVGGLSSVLITSTITNSYNNGAVSGSGNGVGGVAGYVAPDSTITNSYNSGELSGSGIGGVVGILETGGTVNASFFDTTSAGTTTGVGTGSSAGVTGLATVDMMKTSTYADAGWDTTTVWRSYDGHWYPLLKYWLTPIAVSSNDHTKTYDGIGYSGGNGTNYSATPTAFLLGTGTYAGSSQGARNAGTYAIAPDVYSTAQQGGYDATVTSGSLTISPRDLYITTANVSKTYDGGVVAAGSAIATNGTSLEAGDSLNGGTFLYADKNAGGGNKTVTTDGVTINDGNGGANYNLIGYVNNTASTINKAILNVTATGQNKTYDGLTTAAVTYNDDRVAGDILAVGGTAGFNDKNTGTGKAVNVSGINISGTDSNNYTLNSTTSATTADIAKANLIINGITADSKVYDGSAAAVVHSSSASYSGLVTGDDVTVSATGAFSDKNAGADKTVTLNSSIAGVDTGNYNITTQTSALADITKANLAVTANNDQKAYDGLAYSNGNGVVYSGFVNSETSSVLDGFLVYGGNSQGAVKGGNYTIEVSGLTSGNYNISYLKGNLEIQAALTLPVPSPTAPQLQDQIVPLQSSLNASNRVTTGNRCDLSRALVGLGTAATGNINVSANNSACYGTGDNDLNSQLVVLDGGVRRNEAGNRFSVPSVSEGKAF